MKINKSFSSEPRICQAKLNFSINPETLPTLISVEKLKELTKNDDNPYYVTEEILDITEPVKGVTYTPEFWNSYLDKLKDAPLPGSKSGHTSPWEWWVTGDMDFFTIGGELKENSVYLKMYIPPMGYKSQNETFIKALKTGMVHFSIVSWTEDITETNTDGEIVSIKAIRSVKGERNDAAERGMGAMDQRVNKDKPGDNPDNNKSQNKQEVNYIMEEVKYNDIIKNLKNQIENGTVSKLNIATDLKIEVATEEMKTAVKQLKEITKITGENPVEKINEMKSNEENVKQEKYKTMRERLMTQEFGPEKTKENGQEKINLKREAAEPLVNKKIQDEKILKEQIEAAKENAVVKNISFQMTDVNSDMNDMTGVKINTGNNKYRSETIKA